MTSRVRSDRAGSPLRDPDLVNMLVDRPDLLAIADALVETVQPESTGRRVEPRVRSPRLQGWRRRFALAVATLAAIAVPTVALSGTAQRFLGLADRPGPVLDEAQFVLEAPAGDGVVARLYTSPFNRGGECVFTTFAKAGSPIRPVERNGGGSCARTMQLPPGEPFTFSVSLTRLPLASWLRPDPSTGPRAAIDGVVAPDLQAARVELQWASGSENLVFMDDYFLLVTDRLFNPPERDLPFEVVAYDAQGKEVARRKVPSSSLYLGDR
jgi:hypothetical protein